MPDIFQDFPIKAPTRRVFEAVSTPKGLDSWWTKSASGNPSPGGAYELGFGQGYQWRARATRFVPDSDFELELFEADEDWQGTRLGFVLEENDGATQVRFHHIGWPESNEHYRISCYCWAMYLRLLRRYVEQSEVVEYESRLDV